MLDGYNSLPAAQKAQHTEIAVALGLNIDTMSEYDMLVAIVRKIVALEKLKK